MKTIKFLNQFIFKYILEVYKIFEVKLIFKIKNFSKNYNCGILKSNRRIKYKY